MHVQINSHAHHSPGVHRMERSSRWSHWSPVSFTAWHAQLAGAFSMQCVYATVPPPNMALPMAKLKATWPLYLINLWAVYKLVRTHLCVLRILNAVVCVCVCACACVCVLHFTTGLGNFTHIIYAHYNSTVTVIIYNYNII